MASTVSFVANGTAQTDIHGTNRAPLPLPSARRAGDLLIAHITWRNYYTNQEIPTINIPNGWLTLGEKLISNQNPSALIASKTGVYYKIAEENEGSAVFTFTGEDNGYVFARGIISAYRGASADNPIYGYRSGIGDSTAISAHAQPYDIANGTGLELVLYTILYGQYLVTAQPTGMTPRYNVENIKCFSAPVSGESPGVARTATLEYSSPYAYWHIILNPANSNPTLTLTSPADNLTLAEGDTLTISGSVFDADAGNQLSVEYAFGTGQTSSIPLGESDGVNPISFAKTLTYSKGRFWDGQADVSGLLTGIDPVLSVWASDDMSFSETVNRQLHIDQPANGRIYIPVNVVTSAFLTSRMSPPVRLNNGWLVALLIDKGVTVSNQTYNRFYVSKDNGKTWTFAKSLGWSGGLYDLINSIATDGERVYFLFATDAAIWLQGYDPVSNQWTQTEAIQLDTANSIDSVSLAITPDRSTLWWAASTKNSTYPNSYNIRAGSVPINADGTLGEPSAVIQITDLNSTGYDHSYPAITKNNAGNPMVFWTYNKSGTYFVHLRAIVNGSPGAYVTIYDAGSYPQSSPYAIRTPNDRLHVVWHGTDSSDSVNSYIRYSHLKDNSIWSTAKKLVKGQNAVITSDKNGKLFITYEDGGYIKRIESTDEFATWTGPVIVAPGSNPVSFYDPFFQTEFEIPPTLFQASGGGVKYYGVYTANENPETTVTSPEDGLVLTENMSFSITGAVSDVDVDDSVVVKAQINNGVPFNIGTGLSDGTTPIPFTRTLNYRNKRVWNGNTDVVGSDLAQNVDHLLKVWSEDDKGGKSTEIIRKFRVIWNRPPSISGADEDLGTILSPPIKTYSVVDPEGNSFTVTEKINGKVIRTFTGVAGREETITIPHDLWIRLDLDTPHTLTVEATDSQGLKTTRTFTFTRTETHIEFMLDFNNPDVETHFTLDGMPKRVLVTLERYLPPGSSIESVKVCNNALDEEPAWEDATTAVTAGRGYLFTNQTKTADNWGINIWVSIAKGSATERVRLDGYGGAFD